MAQTDAPALVGSRSHLFGISAALVTPFADDGSVNTDLAARQASRVLAQGGNGVTLFGTTGEGASLGASDRQALLDAILNADIPAAKVTVCIVASDIEQALAQARGAIELGVRRLLLTPPYYFKGVSDAGLTDWFSRFIETLDTPDIEIILYHIPQVTGVALSIPLIRKLKDQFGAAIFGVKDSSGNWANGLELLAFKDLAILIGDERLLAKAAPLGGAGAISGMANLIPARLIRIIRTGTNDPDLAQIVDQVVSHPVTPMVKAIVGAYYGEEGWTQVRAPLLPADAAIASTLAKRLTGGKANGG